LEHLTSLIDDKTAALIINNPSNPCGSVFSKDHLLSILSLAYKHKLPIISDEIYADIVFSPAKFHPIASLTDRVPILTVGGLAKQYFVPGWRVGWILIHDRSGLLAEIRRGLVSLSQLILGSNSLVQSVLPALLHQIPPSFYSDSLRQLEDNARFTAEKVSQIPGLRVVIPQGAMYMMVGIDRTQFKDISSDLEFTEKLVQEQSVLCLPGQCFKYPNYFRIVFTSPQDKLKVAYERLAEFCANHLRN
jgi:tyrosine aminotransferase